MARADFRGSRLDHAVFDGANLAGADFTGASLRGACLHDTHAQSTNFSNADLTGARVNRERFRQADRTRARLRRATIRELVTPPKSCTDQYRRYFTSARVRLDGRIFDLDGDLFEEADLDSALFLRTGFNDIDRASHGFTVMSISGTGLDGTIFQDANLRGSLSSMVLLSGIELIDAKFTCATKLPHGLNPAAHGMVLLGSECK